jgi:hypothetical protein
MSSGFPPPRKMATSARPQAFWAKTLDVWHAEAGHIRAETCQTSFIALGRLLHPRSSAFLPLWCPQLLLSTSRCVEEICNDSREATNTAMWSTSPDSYWIRSKPVVDTPASLGHSPGEVPAVQIRKCAAWRTSPGQPGPKSGPEEAASVRKEESDPSPAAR